MKHRPFHHKFVRTVFLKFNSLFSHHDYDFVHFINVYDTIDLVGHETCSRRIPCALEGKVSDKIKQMCPISSEPWIEKQY